MVDTRRIKTLNDASIGTGPVVYVMAREQRTHDNWALLYAVEEATKRNVPVAVLFAVGSMFLHGTARHNQWMVESLQVVEKQLQVLNIPFFVVCGEWSRIVCDFVTTHNIGQVVFDFNPLEPVRSWREMAAKVLPVQTVMVDARNIVPCWEASDKAEFAAYTFRPKITRQLSEFLTPFPKLQKFEIGWPTTTPIVDWEKVRSFRTYDNTIQLPTDISPGAVAAQKVLQEFLELRLSGYAKRRNDPNESGTSRLSAYLRWGNISTGTVAFAVKKTPVDRVDKEAFLEELIVRRELTDNYCWYTKEYATIGAIHPWAQKTLTEHAVDTREFIYSYDEFESAKTHDLLWNAAQLQMVEEGYMHGYMRMYWAKKILEWTPDAQTAIDIALRLNDTYQLDGRDSNGVVGVMWSIGGVHDRAWNERSVFGKIRYMNYAGCKRKFKIQEYIDRYVPNDTQPALLL